MVRLGAQAGAANGEWRSYGGDLGQHALLAARSDQRRQLQQARGRVAVQDRQPRPAPRVQLRGDAADGRTACSTRPPARGARSSRSTRRPARCCGCTARTKARAARRRRGSCPGRGLAYWTDGREERDPLRHARLPAGRARREDRRAGRRLRQERHRRSEAGRRPGDRSRHRRDRPARRRRSSRRTSSSSAPRTRRAARRRARRNEKGYVRGFDVRTGKRLWIFHTIPQPGEFGNDTWEKDSWVVHRQHRRVGADHRSTRSSASSTCRSSCRPATTTAAIVPATACSARASSRVDLQDRQAQVALPVRAPRHLGHGHPVRADPGRHHRQRPRRSRRSRSRPSRRCSTCSIATTGQPIWPIEERPVEKGDVPGEWYSPTQPFPTKPPALRSPGRVDRRSDRLHAGAARGSGEARRRATRSDRSSRRRSSARSKVRWRR